jgi:hypothetical protein
MGEDGADLIHRERLEQRHADIQVPAAPAQTEQLGILPHRRVGLGDQPDVVGRARSHGRGDGSNLRPEPRRALWAEPQADRRRRPGSQHLPGRHENRERHRQGDPDQLAGNHAGRVLDRQQRQRAKQHDSHKRVEVEAEQHRDRQGRADRRDHDTDLGGRRSQ